MSNKKLKENKKNTQNKKNTISDKKLKTNTKIDSILIFVQVLLAASLFLSAIISIFIPNMIKVLEIMIVLFLILGSINSFKLNKNKIMSLLYFLAAIMVIINSIVGFLIEK